MKSTLRRSAALCAAAGLFLIACGDDAAETDTAATTTAESSAESKPAAETTAAPAAETTAPGDSTPAAGGEVGVSLILKNTSNPFFVSMKEDAEANADKLGVKLTVAAGKEDGDTQSQIDAIEAAVANGDKGILITPSGDAVVPAIEAARDAGLLVIALDTPPNPADSVDITFATDNYLAGQLIGQWAAKKLGGEKATIAMLDLFDDQVVSVDTQRDQGFLNGMGIIDELDPSGNGKEPPTGQYSGGDYEVVCHEPTDGAVDGGKSAMEACLAANPDVNVVYTINEPAAQGAYDVLQAAGKEAIIVSVDGGCDPGLRLVAEGVIGATAQQYPGKMASLGMEAIVALANGGEAPKVSDGLDFFNTGVALVTAEAQDGVESISVEEGQKLCWG
jgi:fructose transport system substrate-binding protein